MKIRIDKRDTVFSKLIRLRARFNCENCGKYFPQGHGLQCAHIYSRRHQATRYAPENALALCFACHQYFGEHPLVFAAWVRKTIGDYWYEELDKKHRQIVKRTKKDSEGLYAHLKAQYKAPKLSTPKSMRRLKELLAHVQGRPIQFEDAKISELPVGAMTDLSPAVWKEIEAASLSGSIRLGELRTILKKARRTNDQNALLWALYDDAKKAGGETLGGWTTEEIHEYMLGSYHGWQVLEAFGEKRKRPMKRSSRLTKTEFSDFVEFVVRKFAEHDIIVQLPGEQAA